MLCVISTLKGDKKRESHLIIINNIWETWGIGENALKALVLANSPFPTQQGTLGIDGENDGKRGLPFGEGMITFIPRKTNGYITNKTSLTLKK